MESGKVPRLSRLSRGRYRLALLAFGAIGLAAGLYLIVNRPPTSITRSPLLRIIGPGYKKSSLFQVRAGWEARWAYDCPPSIGQGGFGIVGSFDAIVRNAYGDDAFPQKEISTQGSAGQGTVAYPRGGNLYLEIQSDCNWEVEIFDATPGGFVSSPIPSG